MFTFGQNYERPLMALCALRIRHDEVRPRDWQKALGIPPAATTAKKRGVPESKDEEKARKTKNAKAKRDHKLQLLWLLLGAGFATFLVISAIIQRIT